jgi:hypothetical protein
VEARSPLGHNRQPLTDETITPIAATRGKSPAQVSLRWHMQAPTEIPRSFGMAWGIGGWLMTWFMDRIGPQQAARLRERVAAELTSTFASHITAEISLAQALAVDTIRAYTKRATGGKYAINPTLPAR